jgi:hypothetical protein
MTKITASMLMLTIVLALSACKSDPCKATSKCSADTSPSTAQMSACEASLSGACGSQARDLDDCEDAQQVCGADDKTDLTATTANCASEQAALLACCAADPTACTQPSG